ncbi:MAG: TlpA disulfide reductase family protein [Calditrichia bacterium]
MKFTMMRLAGILFLTVLFLLGCTSKQEEPDEDVIKSTKTVIGQTVPDFGFVTDSGDSLSMQDLSGKVVVINFWANWCPPCRAEFPHLEKEIWQPFKDKDFYLIAFGREHTMDTVKVFKDTMGVSFPLAADPNRDVYGLFADKYIPRTILVDKEGKIVQQLVGFKKEEFKELIENIRKLL